MQKCARIYAAPFPDRNYPDHKVIPIVVISRAQRPAKWCQTESILVNVREVCVQYKMKSLPLSLQIYSWFQYDGAPLHFS